MNDNRLRNLIPLRDGVVVERFTPPPMSKTIIIPDKHTPDLRHNMGKVLSVGPGRHKTEHEIHNRNTDQEYGYRYDDPDNFIPVVTKVGDIVLWGRYDDFKDGDLVLIQEQDIIGIVDQVYA